MSELNKVKVALEKHFFDVYLVETKAQAKEKVLTLISKNAEVGIGGSITIRELNLIESLKSRGNKIIEHWGDFSSEERLFQRKNELLSDVFLSSSNAVTENGELVNIDEFGNRVGAMVFGPKKVVLVIGRNKIVKNVHDAFERIRNVVVPKNARRLNIKLPCSELDYCNDCDSPQRMCRVGTIIYRKPTATEFKIILVNEELGY
jgi:L-lactate utilization protein LutB